MPLLNWKQSNDWEKWNAIIVNGSTNHPHVEIRTTRNGQDIIIAVSLEGRMNFKNGTKSKANVRISSRLPLQFTFQEWQEFNKVIRSAIRKLKTLKKNEQTKMVRMY